MRSPRQLLVFAVLWPLSAAQGADSAPPAVAPAADTSQWKCESCPFEQGTHGAVTVGAGYVSQDSAKFGEYTGLHEKGGYFIGDGEARYRGANATYLNVDVTDLGLTSRSIALEGGRQGQYRLRLGYDELPHYITDTARTPFLGTGGASLTLPSGFPAPTTAQMPLASTLHDVDLDTKRKTFGVAGAWTGMPGWEYAVGYRHEDKDGTQRTAGAFFINAAQLVKPVNYTTDQVDASIAYATARWQAKLSYYGSIFRNDDTALTWQNPFPFPAGSGQLALPPGNEFHQVRGVLGYDLTAGTRLTADVAWGRMTQDEGFLAPTLNTGLGISALPRGSLDGRVNTFDANVKAVSRLSRDLGVSAAYTRSERDNNTPQAAYPWVTTDMFPAAPRVNLPYGFTQDKVRLSGDYRFAPRTKAMVGYDYDRIERTNQEVDATRDNTVWAKLISSAFDKVGGWVKYAHAERDVSDYHAVAGVTPPDNPLLRKYNLTDRTRDSGALRADFTVGERTSIGVGASAAKDSYTNSPVGLNSGKDVTVDADLSVMVMESTTVHFFASYEQIKSRQAGSQTFSTPDWTATNNDRVDFVGVGARHAVIKDKLEIGADYRKLHVRSTIKVDTGVTSQFPDLATNVDSVRVYATYRLNPKVRLNADYWHESYRSDNWMLDNVGPATIPNVLTFGEQAPRYNVNVYRLSATYEF